MNTVNDKRLLLISVLEDRRTNAIMRGNFKTAKNLTRWICFLRGPATRYDIAALYTEYRCNHETIAPAQLTLF